MQMTGGEAVVHALKVHDVDTVFGIPGAHNLALYEALLDAGGIRHIVARHEQGAAFMADGYARASGKVGVCLCTSGPAVLNAVTSLGTAYCDSSPVLCIASEIPSEMIGKEKGFIHECRDQLACLRPVTTWCRLANEVTTIPGMLQEAFLKMQEGRPRPAALEIPCDVLDASDNVEIPEPATWVRRQPSSESIEKAAQLLSQSRRPVIWAGGGLISSGASAELRELAERMQAPVFTTILGRGAIAGDHPLSAGSAMVHPAAREFVASCDVMLAVGTRFTEEEAIGWTLRLPDNLIHVDIDPQEMGRNYPPTVAVVGDARESLRQLNGSLDAMQTKVMEARDGEVARLRQQIVDDCRQIAPQGVELVETLRSALPREAIIVSDLTLAAYWCRRLLDVYEPRTSIYPWGFCTLGFGVSAGIGAKAARPERPVVVISGDGGFLFNCQELATAVQFQLPIVVLLFNNNSYGVLKPQQQVRYGRTLGVDLVNPDFVALAESFGCRGLRVTSLDQLGPAVSQALESDRTWVIEITCDVPLQIMEPGPRSLHAALQGVPPEPTG
jgi:acetolactate synthase-1/2/3 large subunit